MYNLKFTLKEPVLLFNSYLFTSHLFYSKKHMFLSLLLFVCLFVCVCVCLFVGLYDTEQDHSLDVCSIQFLNLFSLFFIFILFSPKKVTSLLNSYVFIVPFICIIFSTVLHSVFQYCKVHICEIKFELN